MLVVALEFRFEETAHANPRRFLGAMHGVHFHPPLMGIRSRSGRYRPGQTTSTLVTSYFA
jgi:hypothetical protein